MTPPCLNCKHRYNPKMGAYLGTQGNNPTMGIYKHRRKRKLKRNPCYDCLLPGEYADYIEQTNPMPPTRPVEVYTVGSNILDRSLNVD